MRMEEPIVREQSNICKGDYHGRVTIVPRPASGNEVLYPFFLACAAPVKANLLLTHFGNLKWTHQYCTARKKAFFKVREFATTLICSAMAAQSVPSEEQGIKVAPLS